MNGSGEDVVGVSKDARRDFSEIIRGRGKGRGTGSRKM